MLKVILTFMLPLAFEVIVWFIALWIIIRAKQRYLPRSCTYFQCTTLHLSVLNVLKALFYFLYFRNCWKCPEGAQGSIPTSSRRRLLQRGSSSNDSEMLVRRSRRKTGLSLSQASYSEVQQVSRTLLRDRQHYQHEQTHTSYTSSVEDP